MPGLMPWRISRLCPHLQKSRARSIEEMSVTLFAQDLGEVQCCCQMKLNFFSTLKLGCRSKSDEFSLFFFFFFMPLYSLTGQFKWLYAPELVHSNDLFWLNPRFAMRWSSRVPLSVTVSVVSCFYNSPFGFFLIESNYGFCTRFLLWHNNE